MAVDLPAVGEDPWGTKLNTAILGIDTAKATILAGTVTPDPATGNPGDYYLGSIDRALFGPKASGTPSYGANQSVHTSQTPNGASASANTYANDITFAADGVITGITFYRHASSALAARTLRVWSSAGALLGTASTSGDSGAGWKIATLATQLLVLAGQTVRVGRDNPTGDTDATFSIGTATVVSGDLTLTRQAYYSTTPGAYPTLTSGDHVLIDVVFKKLTTPNPWPVALRSVPPGGTTGQVLKKTSGADYAVGWVT